MSTRQRGIRALWLAALLALAGLTGAAQDPVTQGPVAQAPAAQAAGQTPPAPDPAEAAAQATDDQAAALAAEAAAEPDTDHDGMPDAWEDFFGLNKNNAADASGDLDGDGVSNLQEYLTKGHPNGRVHRYFAEGATGFFKTSIGLFNPSPTATAKVQVAFVTEQGTTYTKRVELGPRRRATVSANTELGFVLTGISTHVESNIPVAADRFMRWGLTNYGSSLDSGVEAPSTTWYFAEGATGQFLLYYLLFNPGNLPATVQLKYLREGGPPIIKSVTVPAHQRETVFVNTQDLSLLVAAVGAVVTSNRPIVAERAMYQSSLLELYGSGGASSGAPALSDTWYFAEGATGPFFDEYILLGNASATTAADAEVTFRRDDGTPYVKHYTVAPQTRRTIWINDEASSVPALAALATGPVSVTVRSTIPIVAERSMWWSRSGSWYENHASTGLTTPGPTWMVAEAGFDGPTNDQTFVLIANTSAQTGVVRVTAFKDDGTNSAQDYTLGGFARQTVEVGPTFGLTNDRVSVLIESQGTTPLPIVVDYVRYSTTGFRLWNAGGAASAIPLAPSDAAPTVTATTPVSGATNVPRSGNLTITFSEPVNVTPTAFTLECPGGTAIPFTNLTASPATTFTLDPTASLPVSSTCLLTIKATQVTDADTIDPPDQMTADVVVPFSTGACPAITISPNTLPAASIGTAYGPFTFTPSAGATPITWSTSGTLPTGLTLSAAGVLSGTPTASGSFDFTVTATDVDSCSGSQAFTVASSCPTITVSPGSLSPGNVGVSYGPVQFTQTGAPGSVTWSMTGGTLPAGMTLDAAGLLSGTPTAAGTHTFTVTATDANGCTGTVTVTLSVSCPVITVTPNAVLDATVGVAYTAVQFAQTGAPTAVTWSVTSGTLPAGMTVNAAGLFSGTPTAPGTHTFTVTATDANGCSGSVTVTINVTCPEITVTPATLGDGTVGVAYTPVQFAQTGAPTAVTWSVTSGTLPTGMTLNASGLFSGTPTAPGSYTFTVTATDANGCTGAVTVTIQVTCPVITLAPTTLVDASVGAAYTPVQFTQTGSPTSVTWAVTGGTLPTGMTFSSGGLFSGTPTAPGTHTFTVTATDANGCTGTVTVTIQVSCPVITIAPATLLDATVGVAYTPVQFTQTGSPTAVTWAVTSGALPIGLSLSSGGLLSGTPTVPGSSTFTITATDANGCTGTVTITIQTTCPTITVSPTSLTNGVAGVAYGPVTFTQTGSPTSVTWSLSAGTLPAGVTLSAAGVLSGTPTQTGTFPITVVATDANGCTGSVSVTLQIDCPTITITPGTVANATVGVAYTPVTFSQTGGVGAVTWAMTSGTLPTGMTFNPATRQLSGTPTAAGTHTFTLTATDANGCTGTITITLIAECPTITITPATFGPASGGLPFTQTFSVTGGTTPHTWTMTGSVPGLTFTPGTRTLAGTPTQPGTFPLTITATDANGCSGSITPSLTVLPNAVDDVFVATLLGNVAMSTMTVGGFSVLSNDVMGPSPTITGYSALSQRGGTVTMVMSGADAGKFTYDPPAGYEGTDTFTYTASDGANSDTATVTVTVGGGVIWFIDAAASCSTCDGRLSRPFKTLAAFNAINDGVDNSGANSYHPADNDRIFLAENASDYSGSLTLRSGQRLIGQDAVGSLATLANVTPHVTQAALPVLNSSNGTVARIAVSSGSGVLLNSGNHVRGLSVGTSGSTTTGVRGNNFGALALSDVSVSGTGIGVFLNNGTPVASFTSVSSSGATHGIVLTNTSGSFTVTGVGSTAGSGGTLSGATGAGDSANVVLSSAQNVTLNNMVIQNSSQDGVRGTTVSGFAMTNTTVSGNGTAVGHAGLDFAGLTGTVGLTNVTVTGSFQDNMAVRNTSGTVTITVDNSNFTSNSTAGGGDGMLLDASATATITSTVTNSHFTANKDDHFQASAANSAQMNVTFVGNTLAGGHAAPTGGGLTINAATGAPGFSGAVKYDIRNNSINGGVLSGMTVNLGTSAAGSVMQGRISGNTIGTAAVTDSGSAQGFCLAVDAHGNGTHTVLIENNVLRQCHDRGLNIVANDGNGAANITVRNNNISHSNGSSSREAFNLGAGAVDPNIFGIADSHTVCLDLGGGGNPNTLQVSANPPTLGSFLSRQRFNTTVRLPGYAGGTADTTAVRTFIIGNNPGASASSQVTASGTGGGYIGGAACAQPTLP